MSVNYYICNENYLSRMRTLLPEKEKEINLSVKRWLRRQGFTYKDAALRLGVQEMAISMQLSRHFSKNSAARWSQAFGLNEKYLLTGEGPVCDHQTAYQKMVSETENLRRLVRSQQRTIEGLNEALERYRSLYGTLPQAVQACDVEMVFQEQN